MAIKNRPERFLFRFIKGGIAPANGYTAKRVRERGYRVGDEVLVTIAKPRSTGYHRLFHQFGALVADNIEAFERMDAHSVLKRLQLESGLGCDEILIKLPSIGMVPYRIPKSIGYGNMDQGEVEELFKGIARYVVKTYWPTLDESQIEALAGAMPDDA